MPAKAAVRPDVQFQRPHREVLVAAAAPGRASESAWAPLRVRVFRILWLAQLASLIGTWMQTVGAQWLLVDQPNASTLVALVQTATMLPVLLLALPAGVLADAYDRRRLLIAVQVFQFAVGVALTVLTVAGRLPPALLLALTFLLGCGTTLMMPGWQALTPELVSRSELPAASALGGVAQNLARAVGPAIGGVLIAHVGVAAVFALNAASYALLGFVLLRWRREAEDVTDLPERFGGAILAGGRYVRHAPVVRRIMLRSALFVVPGAALWALLPLAASRLLRLGPSGYGLLLAALGVGAVIGAFALPRIRARLPASRSVLLAGLVFAAGMLVVALVRTPAVVAAALVPAGLAWLAVLATLNATMQLFLPNWVRARGLSVYQVVFLGGQGIAALGWGLLAQWWGLPTTFLVAALLMALGAVSIVRWPLHDVHGMDRNPAAYWPEPHLEFEPDPHDGPVLVTRVYRVPEERVPRFLEAMTRVRRSRLRTGATSYGLYRDGADPQRFVEVSQYPTWAEHLRQHAGRLTGTDQAYEEEATALVEGRPEVAHLFPAKAEPPSTG
jgi:MFS family permease